MLSVKYFVECEVHCLVGSTVLSVKFSVECGVLDTV